MSKLLLRIVLGLAPGWAATLGAQPTTCGPVVNTGSNHSILLLNLQPTLNGAPLPPGSYIVALYRDSPVVKCAGYTRWMGVNTAIAAFGNDPLTVEKDGLDVGDHIAYRLELPGGMTVEQPCISVKYASGNLFSNAGTFAVNGISGLAAFDARLAGCPGLCLDVGDACDDGIDTTFNDTVTAGCTCAGAPASVSIRPFALSNAGVFGQADTFCLAWTLGQIAGETLRATPGTHDCYWLRQGFQQPFEWLPPEPAANDSCAIVRSAEARPGLPGVQVFPNPFSGRLTVLFDEAFPHRLSISAPDGRMVYVLESAAAQDQLELGYLPAGLYFLTVIATRRGAGQVFKLINF